METQPIMDAIDPELIERLAARKEEIDAGSPARPGIIAALAFILVFWAHSQYSGQTAILGGLIFLLGLVLILIEIFVLPGFGVSGILGILFMVGGIGLATFDKIPETGEEWTMFGGRIGQYFGALMAAVVVAVIFTRYLPNIPYMNRMVLLPQIGRAHV